MTSLSPLHTVGDQITEALLLHQKSTVIQAEKSACEMLKLVGFPDPNRALKTYPFELSGGLRRLSNDCHGAYLQTIAIDRR